jgi:glutamate racemase
MGRAGAEGAGDRLFAKLLAEHDPEVCIIACNTAFTLVGADLRAAFPA